MNRIYRPCAFGAATRTIFHAISAIDTPASYTPTHVMHAKGSSRSCARSNTRPLQNDNRLRGSRGVDCCITQVSQTDFAVSSRSIRLGSDWISGSANSRSRQPLSLLQYPPFLCHPHATTRSQRNEKARPVVRMPLLVIGASCQGSQQQTHSLTRQSDRDFHRGA